VKAIYSSVTCLLYVPTVKLHALANATKSPNWWKVLGNPPIHFNRSNSYPTQINSMPREIILWNLVHIHLCGPTPTIDRSNSYPKQINLCQLLELVHGGEFVDQVPQNYFPQPQGIRSLLFKLAPCIEKSSYSFLASSCITYVYLTSVGPYLKPQGKILN
jgi:hypothetical protein